MKLRLLETHGCQGAATAGYRRAGWDVTSVDIAPRHAPYYPGQLVIGDAMAYILEHGREFDAIHTSPPCQWYTRGNAERRGQEGGKWDRTIPPMREALESVGRPYVIENVADAAWDLVEPTRLCGCMFGLRAVDKTCNAPGQHPGVCDTEDGVTVYLQRPRLFETSWTLTAPQACEGEGRPRWEHPSQPWVAGVYGGARRDKYDARYVRRGGYVPPVKSVVLELLGFTPEDRAGAQRAEQTWEGLNECIPPAYTEHIGRQLMDALC